jgi:putative methionine-R-sulfoxide reductase with GAF domain
MRRLKLALLTITATLLTLPSIANSIQKGVLDLKNFDFERQNLSFKLNGEVEFYWNQLYTPADFSSNREIVNPLFVKIPKSWASYKIDGEKLPSNGYATYRFVVETKSLKEPHIFGIKMPSVFTSYKLWVNDGLVAQAGNVATTKNEHTPNFFIDDIPFVINPSGNQTERIVFVIQVSNFSHRRAGLAWPITIGSFNEVKKNSRNLDILNLIVVGIILVIGLNHINMYIFRRKDVSNLYFGALSLVMILRNVSTGDRLLAYLFPQISWEVLLTIDNFSGYGTIPFFALFIYHLYKDDFKAWLKNLMVILGAIISLVIFVTPAAVFGKFNMVYELYLLVGGLYLTFGVLLVATFRGRDGAFLTFLGMFLLYATAINDVLSSMELISTPYVAPYGLVMFMLLQTFTMNSKSARAINENEDLSHQLALEKEGLEMSIEERTRELQKQHNILLEHQEREKIQTWINKGLAKVNHLLSTDKSNFNVLSRKVLTTVVKYLGVKLGALYIINDEGDTTTLQMIAHYGGNKDLIDNNQIIGIGDGLVGATFTDNQIQIISDIPSNYYQVNSGLGSSQPRNIFLAPLSTDEAVFGVVELARFDPFSPEEIDFVKKIASSVASNLQNARMNERNVRLINQFQDQAAEIQEKEERMRETLEELEYYRESFNRLKDDIEAKKKKNKKEE